VLAVAEKKLMDLSEIVIDETMNKTERLKKYIRDIGNPYEFRVGDVEVMISFESDGQSLQEKMEGYFSSKII